MPSASADRPTTQASSANAPAVGQSPQAQAQAATEAAAVPAAAQGPRPEAVSAADNPLPGSQADSPAEAEGRRTLSTAFVRLPPGGHLTVELRAGRILTLRDVVMRPKDYCGVQVVGGKARSQFCGGYAEIAGARPGGAPSSRGADSGAANPLGSTGRSGEARDRQ